MADTRGQEPTGSRDTGPQALGGRYELGALLGYGGMAEVFRGRDVRLGRDVAVKVLRSELARDPSFLIRFRREAQSAAALSHPNIVAVYDTGEETTPTGPLPFIVMEYVEGRTLRELLQAEGRLQPRRALEIVAEVCSALEYSHQNGIVHRDIKPGNVMLTRAGAVKVMDFGIARALAASQATVTSTTAVMGTAQYLSPEQARGEHVDARSDVYSTGILLYELLTGRPPFTGDSPVAVAYQHVREDPVPPSTYDPDLAGDLDAVVLKAIAKNPANRYPSAAAFGADLLRAAAGQRVVATPVMSREAATTVMQTSRDDVLQTTVLARSPADPGRGRRGLAYVLLAAAVIAVIVVAAIVVRNLASSGSTGTVKVPKIAGLQKAAAEAKLESVGLAAGTETPMYYTSNAPPTGQVISQSIGDGFVTNTGTKIDFTYSGGVQQTAVPVVVGQSLADATNNLQSAKLKVGTPIQKQVQGQTPGTVLSVAPPAGTMIAINTVVTLTVVSNQATVPVIDGLTLDAAMQALDSAGLTTGAIRSEVNTSVAVGTVLTSSPGQGRNVTQGSSVDIFVATTPAPKPPPTTEAPTPAAPTSAAPATSAPASAAPTTAAAAATTSAAAPPSMPAAPGPPSP